MNEWLIGAAVVFVVLAATVAVLTQDPARQAVVLSVLGLGLAVLFAVLQAPDVALSQLAVGTALTPLLILLTVRKVTRPPSGETGNGEGDRAQKRGQG
ncbi:Na(+)/H(+) antiporter subunit B [Streptomyces sp. NPDC086989]|uniref:Na(+)/H(+) antiporter subunit B n=1 Tax=Streptomyces sp. NPDC086989 TaxID=3365764 RepID=UPI0038024B1B